MSDQTTPGLTLPVAPGTEITPTQIIEPRYRDPGGRPTVMTTQTLEKLREAFLMGCTDREACLFANIASQTLYNYQKANPQYLDLKRVWKEMPTLTARKTVTNAIKHDSELAFKFLERKRRKEFATRQELTGGDEDSAPIKLEYVVPSTQPQPSEDSVRSDSETTHSVDVADGSDDD